MSVAIAAVAGCAGPTVDRASPPPAPSILARPGRTGFVVAALGDRTAGATAIAREIAEQTGFGLVVAPPGASDGPTRSPDEAYARALDEAGRGSLRFLVELREGDRPPCAGPMVIATAGVNAELAVRLRALAELIRDAHLRASPEIARLVVVVDAGERGEGAAPTGAAGQGTTRTLRPERALRIELPPCPQRDWRETYGAMLADFVTEATALSAGR